MASPCVVNCDRLARPRYYFRKSPLGANEFAVTSLLLLIKEKNPPAKLAFYLQALFQSFQFGVQSQGCYIVVCQAPHAVFGNTAPNFGQSPASGPQDPAANI